MEVAVDADKKQVGKGRTGTLENPETYENVPGSVIPIIEREFDDFDTEAEKFLGGELEENQFIGFRLKQGVYGQRQPGVQMVRVKLPYGGVTPDQMDAFASVVEKYAPLNKGHITTRQNIQIHHVPLRDMEQLLREIAEADLSSREGCGNTVRNVTGDPWAGVAPDEIFDPTPFAHAYVRYFVRHPTTQLMPRKIKTSFTGSEADRAISGIHDIAFLSRERDGVKGFEVRVGGGTSIMARVAPTLYEFVEAENGDYMKVAEAVFRIFDRQEWLRVNRARARIKVLVDKIGMDAFRELVDEELEGDWVEEREFGPELVERLRFDDDEEANAPAAPAEVGSPNGDRTEFERFVEGNVQAQLQEGFSAVEVKVERGDLTPEQFRGLGQIMREYTGGYARSTVQQNFVLRWVRDGSLYDVWQRLVDLGLGEAGPREVTDVVSCPGTDSCKLGITSSMGLNRAIKQRVQEMDITDDLTKRIHVKMSGCPNGCSQHHIANIGFYGASLKVGGRQMPAYIPHVGGNYEGGEVIFGKRLKSRLPAKRVPEAVDRWIRLYEAEREDGEEFNAFAERAGAERFEGEIKDLTLPAEFSLETMQQFIDWNRSSPYKVERGEGGVRDMTPPVATIPEIAEIDTEKAEAIAADLEGRTAHEAIEWMFEQFGESHYIACSFQKTSSVTAHIAAQVNPNARFFYLDTDVLFEETYETRDRLAEFLGVEFDRFHNLSLEEQAAQYGDELWKSDPDACCGLRKVDPMRRALSSVDCWLAGVRRGDSASRVKTQKFGWDKKFGLWKLNPLAAWSERDVWNYIREHHLPYNPLHDHGYPSIGCTHCTKPVGPGGSARDGRWAGLSKTECGIN